MGNVLERFALETEPNGIVMALLSRDDGHGGKTAMVEHEQGFSIAFLFQRNRLNGI